MKSLILFCGLLFISVISIAQEEQAQAATGAEVKFIITAYDLQTEELIKGSTMLIYKDGELVVTSVSEGKKNKVEMRGTSKYIGVVQIPGYHDFYFGLDVSKSNDEGKHTLDMPVKMLALNANVEEPTEADIFAYDPDELTEPVMPVPVSELKKQIKK
ncbi:MAG: hypothetical protein R2809_04355 [Flavobacteriales bacterium]